MGKTSRSLGFALVALSSLSVLQTARELLLWQAGDQAYTEEYPMARSFSFGGHTFTVADDQPVDSVHSQADYEGHIQPMMDGQPLGQPSRAHVRRGLTDLGRYHLWFDAWVFRERASGRETLWLARRLQPQEADGPRFEVTTLAPGGSPQRRVLSPWRLGAEYRLVRATQFVSWGAWTAMPLSLGAVFGFFPILLLLFPFGTFVAGVLLIRRRAPAGHRRAAD